MKDLVWDKDDKHRHWKKGWGEAQLGFWEQMHPKAAENSTEKAAENWNKFTRWLGWNGKLAAKSQYA